MWAVYALCSAFFAALTSILAKVGIEGVNSNLATAVRTAVVLVMAWLVVFATGTAEGVWSIGRRSWLFLVLSGLATGASWLFYFKALQIGEASKVIPVDKFSVVLGILQKFLFEAVHYPDFFRVCPSVCSRMCFSGRRRPACPPPRRS